MRVLKLFLLFLAATLWHWAFASLFGRWEISVNMMLVFAIAFCTVLKPVWGYPMAFLCGLFLDFFSTKLFGAHACAFTVAAFGIYNWVQRFDFDSFLPQAAVVFVWTLGVAFLNTLLSVLFASHIIWAGTCSILGGALLGAFCAPAVFWWVHKTMRGSGEPH